MKLRFINTNEPVTTYYRDLVPYFAKRGHESELLVSKAQYRSERNFKEHFSNMPGASVKYLFAGPFKKYNTFISKACVHLFYTLHGFFYMLFGPKADVNIFLTQPPFFYTVGGLLKKLRGTPFYIVVMDLQPDEYVEFGYIKRGGLIDRFSAFATKRAFKQASGIIVIGRCMADVIADKDIERSKIHFIPNWTTETELVPTSLANNRLRQKYNLVNKFVISYGGNIGNAQNFNDLITTAEELKHNSDIVFVLIGGGIKFDEISKIKEEKQLENLLLLPFLHQKYSLSEIYGIGNVNFISLRPSCTGHGVPSKAYVSLAAGRPILFQGDPKCEISRLVQEENIGKTAVTESELRSAILNLATDPAEVKKMGLQSRKLSDSKYSTESACANYYRILINSHQR